MALRCAPLTVIIPRNTECRNVSKVSMSHNGRRSQPNRASILSTRSCTASKIFEDKMMGIVCYRDKQGEVVCEGQDEGPRFSLQPPDHVEHQSLRKLLQIQEYEELRGLQIAEDINDQRAAVQETNGTSIIVEGIF